MRNSTSDLVKGVAVMLMVQVHLMELFAMESQSGSLVGKLLIFGGGAPAAPIFMLIMGYFAMQSSKTFGMQLWRGAKLLLLGFGLNVLLNVHVLLRIAFGTLDIDPWKFVFGVDILPLAGISIMLIALFRYAFARNLIPYIIGILLAVLFPFFDYSFVVPGKAAYLMAFLGGSYAWSYFPLFPWVAYPLTGCVLFILGERATVKLFVEKQGRWLFLLGLAAVGATAFLAAPNIVDLPFYYHHNIFLYVWIVAFCLVWYGLLHKVNALSRRAWVLVYLRWVGKNVTAFYVFQWIIIGNLATWLYLTQRGWQLCCWFVGITLAVSVLVWTWNQLMRIRNQDIVL